jgi:hypothetical protein
MEWFRWWHGTVTDPKFQWVSRRCGFPLSSVLAVWACLLECASTATQCNADATRGNVATFDCNDFDVLLGFDDGTTMKILSAMIDKNLVANGRIVGWEGRQPKREDSGNPNTGALSSTERSRAHRENKKREETQRNAVQRSATLGNDRLDKSREEKQPKASLANALFADFWEQYPKKAAKADAEKAFAKIRPDAELLVVILDGLERAKESTGWTKDDGQYIPHAATWLNKRRWEDELEGHNVTPLFSGEKYL